MPLYYVPDRTVCVCVRAREPETCTNTEKAKRRNTKCLPSICVRCVCSCVRVMYILALSYESRCVYISNTEPQVSEKEAKAEHRDRELTSFHHSIVHMLCRAAVCIHSINILYYSRIYVHIVCISRPK